MVNALHTALALLGYARLRGMGLDGNRQAFPLVVESVLTDGDNFRLLDVFARAQAFMLLLESSWTDRMAVAPEIFTFQNLIDYAFGAIERFRQFPDELGRVLADSPDKRRRRFDEQIKPLEKFLAKAENEDRWLRTPFRNRPPIPEVLACVEYLRKLAQ